MIEVGVIRGFLVALPAVALALRHFGATAYGPVVVSRVPVGVAPAVIQLSYQIWAAYAAQLVLYVTPLLGLIPEEELALGLLLTGSTGAEDRFERVGVVARVPGLSANCHGSRSKVLDLLQVKVEVLSNHGQFGHIFLLTAGMTADEVRDNLLFEIALAVNLVKDALELVEELEGWFAHQVQHFVRRMFRSYLQATTHMLAYQLAGVFAGRLVNLLIISLVQQQVVAHATAYKTLLDARESIDGMVDVEQLAVVGIQVGADARVDARRALTVFAGFAVLAVHAVHIGARPTQVGQVSLEAR